MVGCFGEVCKRRGMKVSADRIKVMVLGGEEVPVYEVNVDGSQLEHILQVLSV